MKVKIHENRCINISNRDPCITLPETNIAMENPPFWWYLPGKMGIFMGYVSFREGNIIDPLIHIWDINLSASYVQPMTICFHIP